MAKTEASSRMRVSIQPRRWSKHRPVAASLPYRKARRTQRLPARQSAERWHQELTQVRDNLLQRQRFESILFQEALPLHLLLRIGDLSFMPPQAFRDGLEGWWGTGRIG